MKASINLPGGELEYTVLRKLWELGTAGAREIHEQVGVPRGVVYTTIAKVLDRLHAKGLVGRKRIGRAFVYRPLVQRELVERARISDTLRRTLMPAALPAIATLVDAVEAIDPDLLDELARVTAKRRKVRRGS